MFVSSYVTPSIASVNDNYDASKAETKGEKQDHEVQQARIAYNIESMADKHK